ncbi:MAG: deoxyribose-phosphate aldolase [Bacteriovoracaceae bacterium]|nr:deoxyribose-phosphate aldolase [Bacteriovoracaceae bacterium]
MNFASYIDHTLLKPDATREQIRKLCQEAIQFQFASVCLNPFYVPQAAKELKGSNVKVCTVVGFPLGSTPTAVKSAETKWVLEHGAQEVDMVMNVAAAKNGEWETVEKDIQALAELCHKSGAILKVIIETCLLTNEEKTLACKASWAAGADFVKTSTGFSTGGATIDDVKLMRKTVGENLGVKASGGIKDAATAEALIAAGANRLGTSSGVSLVTSGTSKGGY